MPTNLEAKIFGMRWCVKPKLVAAWMKTVMDLADTPQEEGD